MTFSPGSRSAAPDIGRLKESGDIRSLLGLLNHPDPGVQWHAAEALGSCGGGAVPLILSVLRSRSVPVRLGAIEALGMIRDNRAVLPVGELLSSEQVPEVRWGAVLALGEIGSADAIPVLLPRLHDPGRYIRYGAALSLCRLGWQPATDAERAGLLIALQDWEGLRDISTAATPHLMTMLHDDDPEIREAVIHILALTGTTGAADAWKTAFRDRNPPIRWRAVLSSMNCGLSRSEQPLMVAARERTGPDPAAAALLNFLFLGIGYNYLGRWWGFPVFMAYMSVLVLAQLALGPFIPYAIAYPVTAVLGVHTYFMAERMADR